jgi:sodium-dependent phosphate cotransporter
MPNDPPDIDLTLIEQIEAKKTSVPNVLNRALSAVPITVNKIQWEKVGIFTISLFLFILAINLMKEGARGLTPLVRDILNIKNPINSLGFGWLFAYVIMSGSPVAATSLAFFNTGVITKLETFTMITGSRLGASFIVLFIGFIYVLRGRDRATSLGMGLLSLTVTGTTYLVGLCVGLWILYNRFFDPIQLHSGAILNSVLDPIFDPILQMCNRLVPRWGLFLMGFGVILLSFNLFDKCMPQMAIKESQVGHMSRLVYKPWVMFLLGAGVTLISMSVSVSISILVPLSARGFVRRENVIPYIMGANITTFIDTLFAAVLLNNPAAFTVVLVEMTSITVVSMIILTTMYHTYERSMLSIVNWIIARPRNLFIFMMVILVVPIILMLL